MPGEIIVRESKDSAYVYKATLKVMLEQDYLKNSATYNFKDERAKALNEYSSQLIRELIIPKLNKEVNSSKRYAALRQVYYSLILSRWFKLRFTGKSGTYASLINTRNLTNLTSQEPWTKTTYFKQYQKSFQDGEYNIKEPVYTPTGQVIRSYFSGGINVASSAINTQNGIILPDDNANKLGDVIGGKAVVEPRSISLHTISQPNSNETSSPITFAMIKDECNWRMTETEKKFTEGPPNRDVFRYDLSKVKREKVGRLVKMLNIGRGAKPPNTIKEEELQTVVEFGKGRNYLWDRPTTPIFTDVNIGGVFTDITINPFPFFREHILLMPERLKEIVAKTDFSSIPEIHINALWQRLIERGYIGRIYVIGDSFKKIKSPSEMDLGVYNNRKEEIYNVFQIYFDGKLSKKFVEQTDFLNIGIDINALWEILIAKDYIYEKGRIQDDFKRMESSSEMDLGHDYNNRRKEQVYQILRQRLNGEHNQKFIQQAATVALEHLRNMNRASYKVAFNSLAAFGSFNHLHLQAFDYTAPGPNGEPYGELDDMPVEKEFEKEYRGKSLIPVTQRNGVTVSALSNWMVRTFVFRSQNAVALQTELLRLTDILYTMNQPFNILFTYNPSEGMYKVYVYPRKPETASIVRLK